MATSMPAARLTLAQMRRSAGRLASAAVAIGIGTGFVAVTLLSGTVITEMTHNQVTATFADAELVVFGDESLTAADVEATRNVEGVAAADPQVNLNSELNHAGKSVFQQIIGVASDERLAPLELSDGAWPAAADEIALPPEVAERLGLGIGDVVASSRWIMDDEPTTFDDGTEGYDGHQINEKLTVTGLVADPFDAYVGSGGAAVMTQAAIAERLSDATEPGQKSATSAILVALEDSADPAVVDAALAGAVPEASNVMTTEEYATETLEEMTGGTNIIYLVFVLAFAVIALVVAGLVIANTFQVLVAQRARTLALLRCVGATTGQLYRSVLLEAAILGTLASLAGIIGGIVLAQGALMVVPLIDQVNVPLPETITLTWPVLVAPLAVGVVVTLVSAIAPALAAGRVAPLAALRPSDAPTLRKGAGRVRAVFATITTVGGLAVVAGGVWFALQEELTPAPVLTLGAVVLGGSVSWIGVIVGSVFWLPKVAAGIGRLVGTTGPSARLATANTLRNPRRTAATATALLIGVTLVGLMTTGAATARAALDNTLSSQYPVDILVSTTTYDDDQQAAMPPVVTDAVSGVEGLEATAQVTEAYVETPDARWPEIDVVAATPDELRAVVNSAEEFGDLRPGTMVIPEMVATNHEIKGLDEIVLNGPGGTTTLDVAVRDLKYGTAFIAPQDLASIHPDLRPNQLWAGVADGQDVAATISAVQDAVASTDEVVNVGGAAAQRDSIQQFIDMVLAIVVGLLAVAVIIALIGVANTLSLSVIERTRESAMLRAIGLSKGQLRAMLAIEGMLIAGVGAVLGVLLGLVYGWAGAISVLSALGEVPLVVPWLDIAAVIGVALIAGLVASVVPARAAVRTHPVAALAAE